MRQLDEMSWGREWLREALDAYQRGLSDAPLLRKWSGSAAKDGTREPDQRMTFVVSTDEVDRHGDVVEASGWRLEAYRLNPVFLWAHDYGCPVIGRAAELRQESHRLVASIEFAPTQFAQEVATLYRQGYQRGVSVGFKPLRYEERRQEKTGAFLGIRFLEQELVEVSAVPVPANRSALRRAEDTVLSLAERGRGFEGVRDAANSDTALEGLWPLLTERVDDLRKLAAELSALLGEPEPGAAGEVAQLLAVLREAHWGGGR